MKLYLFILVLYICFPLLYSFNNSHQLDTPVPITKRKKTFPPISRATIENCLPCYKLAAKKLPKSQILIPISNSPTKKEGSHGIQSPP